MTRVRELSGDQYAALKAQLRRGRIPSELVASVEAVARARLMQLGAIDGDIVKLMDLTGIDRHGENFPDLSERINAFRQNHSALFSGTVVAAPVTDARGLSRQDYRKRKTEMFHDARRAARAMRIG